MILHSLLAMIRNHSLQNGAAKNRLHPKHLFIGQAYEVSPKIKAVVHGHIIEQDKSYGKVHDYFKEKGLPLTQSKSKSNAIGEELSKLIKEGIGDGNRYE